MQEVGKSAPSQNVFPSMITYSVTNVRGVSISLAKDYYPQNIAELEDKDIDAVFALCTINKLPVLIVSCYCRPEISSTKSLKSLLVLLEKAWNWCKKSKVKNMIALGDFNARSSNWGDSIDNPRGKVLSKFIESSSEAKLHSSGRNTFLHSNGGSVIDLSITFGQVSSLLSTPYVENCFTLFTGAPLKGHIPVIQNLVIGPVESKKRRTVLNYDKADWDTWFSDFNNGCEEILLTDSKAEEMISLFSSKLRECNEKNIPTKTVCEHSKPFWSDNLSHLSYALQKANEKYKNRSDPTNKLELEQCKTAFQDALVSEKNHWIHKQLEGLNTSECIEFWKRYKKQFVQKEINFMGHLYKDTNSKILVVDDESKEEVLYKTFFTGEHLKDCNFDEDLYSKINQEIDELKERNWEIDEETANINNSHQDHNVNNLSDEPSGGGYGPDFLNKEIELHEVHEAIKLQKTTGKCCDPDGFHPLLLKKLPPHAIKLLTIIFNKSLKTGHWLWNSSLVTFIKKASKSSYLLPGAYRPLSISSYIGKIMERVLQKRLMNYCQVNNVIDNSQEGFLPIRNTSRYLYRMTSTILEARRRKIQAMLLLIDFQKAFDSVPVSSMIYKLRLQGIKGHFLRLIHSFLSNGTVNLKINNYIGPSRPSGKYGLPQGSVLSPLLFIIYISDLLSTKTLPSSIRESTASFKYADDGSVLITGHDTNSCFRKMQIMCDYLTAWCRKWRLAINCDKDKTEAIVIKTKNSQNTSFPNLQISGKSIEFVSKSKVLGITFDEELNFISHAKAVLSSCWNTWHRLSDNTTRKHGMNCSTLTILFKTAVLTKLLYAAPVWLSNNQSVFDDLFARVMLKITGSQFYPPNPMSQVLLNLPPLALQFEMIVLKFHLKSLSHDDEMKCLILQIEEIPQHPFYQHVMWTKSYLSSIKGNCKLTRRLSLCEDILPNDLIYTKAKMLTYQSKKWDSILVNNHMDYFTTLENYFTIPQQDDLVRTETLSCFPLFSREDSRTENTNLLDFLHGRCLRFRAFKCSITNDTNEDNKTCLDCNKEVDSPSHKLFTCEAFEGKPRSVLISQIKAEHIPIYLLKVIFSLDKETRDAFKDQVDFILSSSLFTDEYQPSVHRRS